MDRSAERGYVLIMFSLSLFLLLGVSGLAIDIGRMYVAKSEAQSFTDAAALSGALKLAEAPGNFAAAIATVASTDKKWEFGNKTFTNITTTFGTSRTDVFTATPPAAGKLAADYKFVRVRAQVNPPMFLLAVAIGKPASSVAAQAMAGLEGLTSVPGGEFPFSPWSRKNAHPEDPNDPFGFRAGNLYTLRWRPPGDKSSCGTDQGNVGTNQDFRGYCCTGSSSAVSVADILAGGGTVPMSIGDPFAPLIAQGQMQTISIIDFINADTDQNAPNYAAYKGAHKGNNKRIVIAPVNDGMHNIVGFAAFFLLPSSEYNGQDYCGEYIGSFVQGAPMILPGGGYGVYRLQLFE
jgi:Flp pilus assembly protein TadG